MNILEPIKKFVSNNIRIETSVAFVGGALITAIFLNPFLEPVTEKIKDIFRSKPHLVLNVDEVNELKQGSHLKNFKLLFGTQNNRATIVAAQTGSDELSEAYDETNIPEILSPCENCVEYSFAAKNIGSGKARNVTIDLISLSEIDIFENEKDPKISSVSCGGIGNNKGCRLSIPLLGAGEMVYFSAISQVPGIRSADCKIDGDNKRCEKNFRNFYAQTFSEDMIFEMNGQKINLPPLNQGKELIRYHWVPQEHRWVETQF